jgi:hypothetical protein
MDVEEKDILSRNTLANLYCRHYFVSVAERSHRPGSSKSNILSQINVDPIGRYLSSTLLFGIERQTMADNMNSIPWSERTPEHSKLTSK